MISAPPALSRALLTPGPLPPHSHLGATLLRHAVATGLRYALYHLGLPVPEAPPVRIVRLRLYLDLGKLEKVLRGAPGGMEVAAALLDPGGAGTLPAGAGRIAAAAAFHRARLALRRSPADRLPEVGGAGREAAPWPRFEAELSRMLRRTNEALLAELLAALDRRARRARGEEVPPVPGRAAAAFLAGGTAARHGGRAGRALEKLGVPDPLAPSWAGRPDLAERVRNELTAVRGEDRAAPAARDLTDVAEIKKGLGTTVQSPARFGSSEETTYAASRRAGGGPARDGAPERRGPRAAGDRFRGSFREAWRAALTRLAPLLAAHAAAAVARGSIDKEEDAYFVALDLQDDLVRASRPPWIAAAVRDNRAEREALLATSEPAELLRTGLETEEENSPAAWDRTPLLPLP